MGEVSLAHSYPELFRVTGVVARTSDRGHVAEV